jgi:hypothetical protein
MPIGMWNAYAKYPEGIQKAQDRLRAGIFLPSSAQVGCILCDQMHKDIRTKTLRLMKTLKVN